MSDIYRCGRTNICRFILVQWRNGMPDGTIISGCCDNEAPVVTGTEEYKGRRRRERRNKSEMGEGVKSAEGISDGENGWRGWARGGGGH